VKIRHGTTVCIDPESLLECPVWWSTQRIASSLSLLEARAFGSKLWAWVRAQTNSELKFSKSFEQTQAQVWAMVKFPSRPKICLGSVWLIWVMLGPVETIYSWLFGIIVGKIGTFRTILDVLRWLKLELLVMRFRPEPELELFKSLWANSSSSLEFRASSG